MKTDGGYLLNLVCPRGLAGTSTGCWVLVVMGGAMGGERGWWWINIQGAH